jgi:amidohydrolase
MATMYEKAKGIKQKIVEWRRTIHQNPETSFEELRTAELVARTLADLGIEAQSGVGKTGVVGYIGDGDGPIIAIRADMDALPITEANDVPYKSQVPGKMHACGHDAHTAILLGAAMLLSKENINGQVRLLFQPSEEARDKEGKSGATRMMDDGALKDVKHAIALHVNGAIDAGQIAVKAGKGSAASDRFHATIHGTGGHAAAPHRGTDPLWMATHVLNAMYAIPSRRIDAHEPSILTIGVVRGGTVCNVIPSSVLIEGTMRSKDDAVREQLIAEVKNCLELVKPLGGSYDLEIENGYPAMINDEGVCQVIENAARDLLGENGLGTSIATMGGEDFSYMTRQAAGAMFSLGTRAPGTPSRFVHTPIFDIDEDSLPVGAAVLAETALRLLKNK